MTTKLFLLLILALFSTLFIHSASLADSGQVTETTAKGVINWTEGSVSSWQTAEPEGEALTTKGHPTPDNIALKGALAQLSATIRKIRIDSEFAVGEYILKRNELISQIETMAANAPVIDKQYLSDGTIKVTVKLAFSGGFSQLLLPGNIKQIEPVKTIGTDSRKPLEASLHTGLIVDATGLKIRPCLSPLVVDESGREVYGPQFISREYAVHKGVSSFVKTMESAKKSGRPGIKPLVVRGLRGINGTNIVISNSDASKIRSDARHLDFLNECRVVIVVK